MGGGGDVVEARKARKPTWQLDTLTGPLAMEPGVSGRIMPPTPPVYDTQSVQSITGSGPGAVASDWSCPCTHRFGQKVAGMSEVEGFRTIQFQPASNSSGSQSQGARGVGLEGRDIMVLPLTFSTANAWLASSPPAAPARVACAKSASEAAAAGGTSAGPTAGGHRRSNAAGGESKQSQDQCSQLLRREVAHELDVTSAAPVLWARADNSSSGVFWDEGWRGSRFLSSASGLQRVRLPAASGADGDTLTFLPEESRSGQGGGAGAEGTGGLQRTQQLDRRILQLKKFSALSSPDEDRTIYNACLWRAH